jgi:protein-S-isoprenylcysteine O-methyltransferase Ste14
VTRGPYAFARHPMYLGWTSIVAGIALVRNNGWLAVGLVPLALAIDVAARNEERRLRASLGDDYARYAARVGRYGPRGRDRPNERRGRDLTQAGDED